MTAGQAFSVVSYMRRVRAGVGAPPAVSPEMATTSLIVGRYCASCHMLDGDGGSAGPDLTAIGKTRGASWLKEWIIDPSVVDPAASMPAFGETLSEEEMSALVQHLAGRKRGRGSGARGLEPDAQWACALSKNGARAIFRRFF